MRARSQQLEASRYFFAGALCGVLTFSMIELGRLLLAKMVSEIEVSMKMMAHQVVSRERAVAVPRGPNAVWLPMPPKVAAISALLPCCSSTTTIKTAQTNT
jgi:hypothetical protein